MMKRYYDKKDKRVLVYGDIEILLNEKNIDELIKYCEANNYRFEIKGTHIVLKRKTYLTKKRNDKIRIVSGRWIDTNGSVVANIRKAVMSDKFVCFESENKITYILKDFFKEL